MVFQLLRRFRSAWIRHGPFGLPSLVLKNAKHATRHLIRANRFDRANRSPLRARFDEEWGAETAGIREVGSLQIDSENLRYAVRYEPTPYQLATELIDYLEVAHEHFTFIDFGAGKGRVLLLAAAKPFQSVVGVEFARQLQEIATANIERLPADRRRARELVCLHLDATHYEVPSTPLVCFFYNPFGAVVMRAVVDRLVKSIEQTPRDVFVIYVNPEHRQILDVEDRWAIVAEGARYVIYAAQRE